MTELDQSGLRRSALRARRLVEALAAFTTLAMIGCALWGIVDPVGFGVLLIEQGMTADAAMATWQIVALDLVLLVQMGIGLGLLLTLRGLFGALAAATPFSPEAGACARNAWRWVVAAFVASLLADPVASVVGTLHLPEGERMLSISFDSGDALMLVALALTAIMSHALSLAAALWQDHQEIV